MYRYSCMWKITPKEVLFALLKGPTTNLKKSFGGKSFSRNVLTKKHRKAAKKTQVFCREKYHKKYRWNHKKKKQKKKLSRFAEIFGPWKKKVCLFELCPMLIKIYTMGFGRKNRLSGKWFSPIRNEVYIFLNTRRCSNSQKFFSSRQPSIRKKK